MSEEQNNLENRSTEYKPKWYFSYPVLISAMVCCCFPLSFVLTILRFKDLKKQSGGYRLRSKIMLGVHIGLFFLFAFGVVINYQETRWVKEYDTYMQSGNFTAAKEVLDENAVSPITKTMVDRYLNICEVSGDFSGIEFIVERYYEELNEKTEFNDDLKNRISDFQANLSEEQNKKITEILEAVETARAEQQARIQAEEESKVQEAALKESQEAAEKALAESLEKAEKERKEQEASQKAAEKALEESRKQAEDESKAQEAASREAQKAAEQKAEAEARINEYMADYLKKPSSKIIKKLAKEDETFVKEVWNRKMNDCVMSVDSDSINISKLEDYCELYSELYSNENNRNILSSIKNIKELEKQKEDLEPYKIGKKSFNLEEIIDNAQSGEWYVTQRLETYYDDTISGAIQKEIDSHSRSNGSEWVAYNVKYEWGQAWPGDTEVVICSSEVNAFSKQGAYLLTYVDTSDKKTLVNSKGFRFEVPVYYLIPDINEIYERANLLDKANGDIETEIMKIKMELSIR